MYTGSRRASLALGTLTTLGMLLSVPAVSWGDTVDSAEVVVGEEEVEEIVEKPCDPCDDAPNQGNVSLSAGIDFPTAYFFRGILQERDGFIMWPWANIGIKVFENDTGQSVTLKAGIWNSFQSNKTLESGSGPSNWYEADIIGGVGVGLTEYLTLDLSYIAYASPNGAFNTVQEFDAGLSLNDSEWLGAFAIKPSMIWAFELENAAFGGTQEFGPNEGIYLQLGANPGYTFAAESEYPVTLSVPLQLGLSVSDYYEIVDEDGATIEDQTFGFFDFGVALSVPLSFIDSKYGSWAVTGAFHGISLSKTLADANRGDGFFPWGVLGVSMTY